MAVIKERYRRPQQAEMGRRVRPAFEDFHLLRMEGDAEYPRHQHTRYEVIFVERGPYRCELNSTELTLGNGEVLVIKPGDWHQDHLRDGQRHYVLHFRIESAIEGVPPPPLFHDGVSSDVQVCRGAAHAGHLRLLHELGDEANDSAAYAGAVQDGLLEVLFWRIVRGLSPEVLSVPFRQLPEREARREEIAAVFLGFLSKNPNV